MNSDRELWDQVQYEAFCAQHPIEYYQWLLLAVEWTEGSADICPYPLDEKEANQKIMEKLH